MTFCMTFYGRLCARFYHRADQPRGAQSRVEPQRFAVRQISAQRNLLAGEELVHGLPLAQAKKLGHSSARALGIGAGAQPAVESELIVLFPGLVQGAAQTSGAW